MPAATAPPSSRFFDITIFVGRNRAPYIVSSETLQGSAYFRIKIEGMREKFDPASSPIRPSPPLVVDCEESVFQNVLCLLRYGSTEALPRMADADLFRLRKEVEFYGIEWPEPAKNAKLGLVSPKVTSPLPIPATAAAAAAAGPVSTSTPPSLARPSLSAMAAPTQRHISVAEFPDFPSEIGDPAKLILVQRADDDSRARCSCTPLDQQSTWALSFYHRHAFCTGCSNPSTNSISPRFLAEMFMAAAAFYSSDHKLNSKWGVGCDSTCGLKFLNARSCCTCSCSRHSTVWVVSTYHSHAFCSQCGVHADGATLICILLTVRYGGLHRSPSKGKRCDHISAVDIPISSREAPKLQPAPSYKQRSSPEAQIPRNSRLS
ncbi:hypothetical protein MPTK1_4g21420 [Marchantia polymorpha subsp. ruderalis]|uniref:BTB domain-containing protein n=2 Tax=Marchantia polymorpha TaxID=3197 RepID=A0AAF6BCA7_MARPO|nr:hypothetical protein MARPO_0090s0079 [Marchantia polymorpha]BBN09641.1 hypothetical protein Mp_4g21420 [Marchantia polymorpha subsp. ruderalis]|eukprot:PTQ33345.1 hypothetical protein MARPO_0090s0079 [Marchantia polymorpha]